MIVVHEIFSLAQPLSVSLQARNMDLAAAVELANNLLLKNTAITQSQNFMNCIPLLKIWLKKSAKKLQFQEKPSIRAIVITMILDRPKNIVDYQSSYRLLTTSYVV